MLDAFTQDHGPKFHGFKKQDFTGEIPSVEIKSEVPYEFDNAGRYFQITRGDGLNLLESARTITPNPNNADESILDKINFTPRISGRFLNETRYIDFSHPLVQAAVDLVKEILPRPPVLPSIRQTLSVILVGTNRLLNYDRFALGHDLIKPFRASLALARGEGVCQHFSAVFVAIARAIGLPARVVNGFILRWNDHDNAPEFDYHAWVEVQIDESTWWPIEPQAVNRFSLPWRLRYFPIEVSEDYERPAGKQPEESEASHSEKSFYNNPQFTVTKRVAESSDSTSTASGDFFPPMLGDSSLGSGMNLTAEKATAPVDPNLVPRRLRNAIGYRKRLD